MKISRALKGERIADAARIVVMFGVMTEVLNELILCRFSMPELVGKAWG